MRRPTTTEIAVVNVSDIPNEPLFEIWDGDGPGKGDLLATAAGEPALRRALREAGLETESASEAAAAASRSRVSTVIVPPSGSTGQADSGSDDPQNR